MDLDKEVEQFWTPNQQRMMRLYDKFFEPINRALRWAHARFTHGTKAFKDSK